MLYLQFLSMSQLIKEEFTQAVGNIRPTQQELKEYRVSFDRTKNKLWLIPLADAVDFNTVRSRRKQAT